MFQFAEHLRKITEEFANNNIGVRDGHMYTPRLMKRSGLALETGAVRHPWFTTTRYKRCAESVALWLR